MTQTDFTKELNKLKRSNYFVAYLDILGASKYMQDDNEQFLRDLNTLYEDTMQDIMLTNILSKKNLVIKIFSDNILIAVKTTKQDIDRQSKLVKVINLVGNLYCNALRLGYLVRGSITEGKFYRNKTFVYGKALVEAVKLEEKIAIYPRVIIQDNLVSLIPQYIAQDNDRKYYLNSFIFAKVFDKNIFKLGILNQLKNCSNSEDVKQKVLWLVTYFNNFQQSPYNGSIEKIEISQQEINEALSSLCEVNHE